MSFVLELGMALAFAFDIAMGFEFELAFYPFKAAAPVLLELVFVVLVEVTLVVAL